MKSDYRLGDAGAALDELRRLTSPAPWTLHLLRCVEDELAAWDRCADELQQRATNIRKALRHSMPQNMTSGVTITHFGFWPIWENSEIYVGIAVHKQHHLSDTIFNYMFPVWTSRKISIEK